MRLGPAVGLLGLGALGAPLEAQLGPVGLAGGVTLVGQAADDDRVRSEVVGSLDLFLSLPLGAGSIEAYVEGNTTPFDAGVSSAIALANTDAGTALDGRGNGRVQLSELRLVWPVAGDLRGHVGLIDATGFLDVSRIANDENLFFIAAPFVNNPTIAFPDYTLSLALDGTPFAGSPVRVGAFLGSSAGLADHPSASYDQLLDVNADGEGLFAGAAVRWEEGHRRLSIGGWLRTDEAPTLDGNGGSASGRGLFSVVGWTFGEHSLAVRLGLADRDVSTTRGFTGLTYLWARGADAAGLALGRSYRSPLAVGLEDTVQLEAFLRRRLVREVFATLSVQRIENPGFDGTGRTVGPGVWVGGLRLSAVF